MATDMSHMVTVPAATAWGETIARYAQKCETCGGMVMPGHPIKKRGGGAWVHQTCPDGVRTHIALLSEGESAEERMEEHLRKKGMKATEEQLRFLKAVPAAPSSVLRAKARAGAGKTTMAALLAHKILLVEPTSKIGYFCFNKKNADEARRGGAFDTDRVSIRTLDGHVRKWCVANGLIDSGGCKNDDIKGWKVEDIVRYLNLNDEMGMRLREERGGQVDEKLKKASEVLAKRVGRAVLQTLETWMASADDELGEKHVPWRLRHSMPAHTTWYTRFGGNGKEFAAYARRWWEQPQDRLQKTFSWMKKVAQLRGLALQLDFQHIIIDEAQDLTACESAAFWQHAHPPTVYLLGDDRQQLYRWRGAGDAFETLVPAKGCDFVLSCSFRFGPAIADFATLVLRHCGDGSERVVAKNDDQGRVVALDEGEDPFAGVAKTVVVCRTNAGTVDAVWQNPGPDKKPRPWAFTYTNKVKRLDELLRVEGKYEKMLKLYLADRDARAEAMVEAAVEEKLKAKGVFVKFDGEEWFTWEGFKTCVAEAEVTIDDLHTHIKLIESYEEQLYNMHTMMKAAWRANATDRDVEVAVTTCHRAKGLEWVEPVLLWRDYGWGDLERHAGEVKKWLQAMAEGCAGDAPYKRWAKDATNLVYVAGTRARRELRLCYEAARYLAALQELSALDRPECEVLEDPVARLRAKEAEWGAEWGAYVARVRADPGHVSSTLPPWPPASNPFFLCDETPADEAQQRLRTAQRRYHTDGFRRAACLSCADPLPPDLSDGLTRLFTQAGRDLKQLQREMMAACDDEDVAGAPPAKRRRRS